MTSNYLIRLERDIVNNVTNKTVVVFENHQTNKIEVAMISDFHSMTIAKVFCNWIKTQSSELKDMFDMYKLDSWTTDVVSAAFPIFVNKDKCSDYEGLYLEDGGSIGLMTSKREVKDTDIILCSDDANTICTISFTYRNVMSNCIQRFSMRFTNVDNIKRFN